MNIKFSVQYDIVVAGAGIAGIAAALQAARCGKRVALLEKMILPGGLATSGLVYIYLPLCDGNGTQVLYGLPEELLLASIAYGPGDIPPDWRKEKTRRNSGVIGRYFRRRRLFWRWMNFLSGMESISGTIPASAIPF